MDLNKDQFLFHGTATEIPGNKVLPAKVHGGTSHWGDTGATRREPANKYAWAVPDEERAWKFAHDRVIHTSNEEDWNPRARVYAVKPNSRMSPGHDRSIPGEIKAPSFTIAERRDIMPGRQGTFPEINWNNHVLHTGAFSDDEDANHPKDNSVTYGHRLGSWGDHWNGPMMRAARDEDNQHYMQRLDDRNIKPKFEPKPDTLPGMMNDKQFAGRRFR